MGSSQPREAQASPLLRLSTRALPERDRFEVFRETFSQYVYRGDITNRAEGTFEGGIDLLKAGSVAISKSPRCRRFTRARGVMPPIPTRH